MTLARRLARLKNRVCSALSPRSDGAVTGPSRQPAAKKETAWHAHDFRRASAALRRAGDFAAAEEICARGISRHPADVPLAMEHVEIAHAAKDGAARLARCQHVFDLTAGTAPAPAPAPARAFGFLAECHRQSGDLDLAETVLADGLALHPADFSLLEKLAARLSAKGNTAAAIAAWAALIRTHPDKVPASVYLKMSLALGEEGLLERVRKVLRNGLEKHPEDSALLEAMAKFTALLTKPSEAPLPFDPATGATAHLFRDHFEPHGQGTVAFSLGDTAWRQHVPAMLDFAETVPIPLEASATNSINAFAVWGAPSAQHTPVREMAAAGRKPLLYLDSGFLSSPSIEGVEAPAHSIIVCPDGAYFDATRVSHLEQILNSDHTALTPEQLARAESCIAAIVQNRLSKFNHAPRRDMRAQFPANGTPRILLVDQRKGGPSIHWSLGGQATFERMWETALSMKDHQILVKLHPEVIAGRARSQFQALLPDPLPENVTLIDFDVNPHDLFEVVDQVFVCSSQLGFEAVLAGKEVHCFAAPYYAGWGFTHDELAIPRRKSRRTPAEVFHLFFIVHSRYFVPDRGVVEIEDLIKHLVVARDRPALTKPAEDSTGSSSQNDEPPNPLKILMVIPSGRYGATGRYLQTLSISLRRLGCEIMILAEGPCRRLEDGVHWVTLDFDGLRLTQSIRRKIANFAPHFIYENGVRSRAQRAALEAVVITGARFAMQSEDDDVQIHHHRQSATAADHLVALDRPKLDLADIAHFLRENDWNHSLRVFLDPDFNRWIEPLLRTVCYRMASFHSAIWHPFADRLAREYAVPTLVVPPVACAADFTRIAMTPDEREVVLRRYSIAPASVVIFIGGALYNYSGEFAVFLEALNLAAHADAGKFALVVASGRTSLPLARMAAQRLGTHVTFADIGVASDELYMEMLKACDVVCSPGVPDDFNRYRLPSRLVKAMAMAKPVLTCRCGFGESLEHMGNAFLTDGEDPASWAEVIALTGDASIRSEVGVRGRDFALEHFDAHKVATALKHQFEQSLREPPHELAASIEISANEDDRPRPKIRLRSRQHSSLQPVIHALALRTHRLDTVVHIGTGECDELDDYCRLGARRIHLIACSPHATASLRAAENSGGSITFEELAASAEDFAPSRMAAALAPPSCYDLLAVALDGTGADRLASAESAFFERFRWILITHLAAPLEARLTSMGFERIALAPNHTDLVPAVFFARRSAPSR